MSDQELKPALIPWQGNKFKLLPELLPLLPERVETFYDLFGGSGSVSLNMLPRADQVVMNDKAEPLIKMMHFFTHTSLEMLIEQVAREYEELSRVGYYQYRERHKRLDSPVATFLLIFHSYCNLYRVNKQGEFNAPRGNVKQLDYLLKQAALFQAGKDIKFTCRSFDEFTEFNPGDFVYLDPPYYLTPTGYSRNLPKGFYTSVLEYAKQLNEQGVKFALSNLLKNSKGETYQELQDFILDNRFTCHHLNHQYKSNRKKVCLTRNDEVLVTNY